MTYNFPLATRNGSANSEMNSFGISTESMLNIMFLPEKYGIRVCNDEAHDCYGMEIEIFEGTWLGHFVHIEKVDEDWFNFSVDRKPLRLNQTYSQMEVYMNGIR